MTTLLVAAGGVLGVLAARDAIGIGVLGGFTTFSNLARALR